jgi:hypothetical protein
VTPEEHLAAARDGLDPQSAALVSQVLLVVQTRRAIAEATVHVPQVHRAVQIYEVAQVGELVTVRDTRNGSTRTLTVGAFAALASPGEAWK